MGRLVLDTRDCRKEIQSMRDSHFLVYSVLIVAGILALSAGAVAVEPPPQTTIRLGLGVWDTHDGEPGVTVHRGEPDSNERFTDVDISGLSGAFSFSRMMGGRFAWEFSIGGLYSGENHVLQSKVETRYSGDYYGDYYEEISSSHYYVSVCYVTVGLIYYPLYELKDTFGSLSSFLRPYLTAGIGPYFGWDGRWDNDSLVDANFSSAMGAYPGIGLDLLLSRNFIFNIDLRYHLVEFGKPLKGAEDYSGLNAIAGFKVAF